MADPRRPHVVIQQPPTYSLHHPDELLPDPIIPYPQTLFKSPEFHSQITLIEKHLTAKRMSFVPKSPLPADVFRTQVAEIDALIDAGKKFENLCTLAADDCPPPIEEKRSNTDWRSPQRPVRRWVGGLEPLYYNGYGLPISYPPLEENARVPTVDVLEGLCDTGRQVVNLYTNAVEDRLISYQGQTLDYRQSTSSKACATLVGKS
ncbi:hypothetical protein BDR22DRAFT_892710 [Usnea florida]